MTRRETLIEHIVEIVRALDAEIECFEKEYTNTRINFEREFGKTIKDGHLHNPLVVKFVEKY